MRRRTHRPRGSLGVVDPRVWSIALEDVMRDLDAGWQHWPDVDGDRPRR